MAPLREQLHHRLAAEAATLAAQPLGAASRYRSIAQFVLAQGAPFVSAALTSEERRIVEAMAKNHHALHGRPFEWRQCFVNSQEALVLDASRRVVYVEGHIFDQGTGCTHLHGWLSIGGKVIDFTGPPADPRRLPPEPPRILGEFEGRAYHGVRFKRAYVRERAAATNGFGTLIDDWQHGFPVLTRAPHAWRWGRGPRSDQGTPARSRLDGAARSR